MVGGPKIPKRIQQCLVIRVILRHVGAQQHAAA